jgi:plasmid stabilization system protein ParE
MKWKLSWSDDAEDDLARIYLDSADRSRVTWAAALGERLLMQDPSGIAGRLPEGLLYLNSGPLRIYFDIDEKLHEVRIHAVGQLTIRLE